MAERINKVVIGNADATHRPVSTTVLPAVLTVPTTIFVVALAIIFGNTVSHHSSSADIQDARYASFAMRVPSHTVDPFTTLEGS